MRMVPERIKEQDVEALQLGQRLLRNAAEISEISSRTEAIALDGSVAVMHRQRSKRGPEEVQRPLHRLYLNLCESTVLVVRLEDVAKDAAQHLSGRVAGK